MAGGFSTEVEVNGLAEAQRILAQVRNLGEDPHDLLVIAGSVLEASTRRRFETGRGVGGIPWPISRRAAGLVKGKPAGRTLVDTQELQDSIAPEVRPNEVEIGVKALSNPVKAIANQFGSHRQTVVLPHTRTVNSAFGVPLPGPVTQNVRAHGRITNLPARAFIGVDDEDKADLNEVWREHLIGLFGQ